MLLTRLIVLISLLIPLGGCSSLLDFDPGLDAGVIPSNTLEVLTPEPVTLAADESALIEVRLLDPSGQPLAGAEVTFRIDSADASLDATLTDLLGTTDADGVATTTVEAGSAATAFRIRASADDASPVFIDVSVSDMGFGDIEATASYGGTAMPGALHVVSFGETNCDEALATVGSPDRMQSLPPTGGTTTFVALPAGVDYAVGVFVESSTGAIIAWGCVESVAVLADDATPVMVVALDLPMGVSGVYAAEAEVAMADAPAIVETALTSGSAALVSAAGGDAAYLLGGMSTALSGDGDACAGDFAMALGANVAALGPQLTMQGLGPEGAMASLATSLALNSERVDLTGALTISGDDPASAVIGYELNGLALGPNDGSEPLLVDPVALGIDLTGAFDASFDLDGDQLVLTELALSITASQIVVALALIEVDTTGVASAAELIRDDAGCALAVGLPGVMATGCDAGALAAACDEALEQLVSGTMASVSSGADLQHDEVRIGGTFAVTDLDDDHQADQIMGNVTGSWTSDMPIMPAAVTGTFSAYRVGDVTP